MKTDGKNKYTGTLRTGAEIFMNQLGAIGNKRSESRNKNRLLLS
jgi:hypothetical protein